MSDKDILVRFVIKDDGTVALNRVTESAKKTEKQLNETGEAGERAGHKIRSGAKAPESDMTKLMGTVGKLAAGIGVIAVASKAFSVMSQFIGGSIKASIEAQQVAADLGAALGTLGIKYKEVEGELTSMALTLQRTTKYEDEEVLGAFKSLINVTGDYNASLKLMQSVVDVAAAKNMDLGTAAEVVGKAGAGVTTMLGRYGIILDETTQKQIQNSSAMERATILADIFAEKFGGQAQAQLQGFGAQVAQLSNYWGNFREALGDVVTDGVSGAGMLGGLRDALGTLTEWVKKGHEALDAMASSSLWQSISSSLSSIGDSVKTVAGLLGREFIDMLETVAKVIGTVLVIQLKYLATALDAIAWAWRGIATAFESVDKVLNDMETGLGGTNESITQQAALLVKSGTAASATAQQQAKLNEWTAKGDKLVRSNSAALEKYVKGAEAAAKSDKEAAEAKKLADERMKAALKTLQDYENAQYEYQKAVEDGLGAMENEWGHYYDSTEYAQLGQEQQFKTSMDSIGDAIYDFAREGANSIDFAAAQTKTMLANAKQNAEDWSEEFKALIAGTFADGISEILLGDLDDLGSIFESAFTTLAEGAAQVFGKVFTDTLADTGGASFGSTFQANLMEQLNKNPETFIAGGLGTAYNARQSQNRGAAAVQGALGGAMAGAGIAGAMGWLSSGAGAGLAAIGPAGWIAIGVGAIVMGALAYFGSGGAETPHMTANVGPDGALVTDSGGGAGMSPERRRAWEEKIRAAYSGLQNQFRSALEMLNDPDLFNLLGDDPSWAGTGNPQDLAQILVDNILPDAFQEQFSEAFRTGLMAMGMTSERFDELSAVMADIPGTERLALLTNYIQVLKTLNELMDLSGDLRGAATESPWDQWNEGFEDVMNQVEVFRSGWDDLDLTQQVAQGQKTVDLLTIWYSNAVEYMRSLIAMQDQMQGRIDSLREKLTLDGMSGYQQGQYWMDLYESSMSGLRGAQNPEDAQRYFDEAMRALEALSGMGNLDDLIAGLTGGEYQFGEDYLLAMLGPLETLMQDVMGGFQDRVQEQADAIYAELELMFANLTGQEGGVGQLDSAATNATNSVDYMGYAANDAADALIAVGDGLETFAERMEAVIRSMSRMARRDSYSSAAAM